MFAKPVAKYLLLAGASFWLASVPAMANNTTPSKPTVAEPAKKKVLTKEELLAPEYVQKLSQTYGHIIQKNLDNPVIKLNITDVIKGIQDANEGKPSPLKDSDCEDAFRLLQQYAQKEMLGRNLEESETFLKNNSSQDGVIEVEAGKVQYKVLQPGSGDVVSHNAMVTINYSATYLNGMSLGSSDQHGGPIEIMLDEAIPGFRKGMTGMRVGEKRRLFVHPDFAYGSTGQHPNGLLMFDVEVIKTMPRPPKQDSDVVGAADSVETSDPYQLTEDDASGDLDDEVEFEDTEDYDLPMMLDGDDLDDDDDDDDIDDEDYDDSDDDDDDDDIEEDEE